MWFHRNLFVCLGLLIVQIPSANAEKQQEWRQLSDRDGILVWAREFPDSEIKAFKGQTVMPLKAESIASVLFSEDVELAKKWVDLLDVVKVIERTSVDRALIYTEYHLPFPLNNRSFVSELIREYSPDGSKIYMRTKSIEHPDYPLADAKGVRGVLHDSFFELEPLPDGGTRVTCQIFVDPKGNLPSWVINLVNQNWPTNTLEGLYHEAKKLEE